MTLYKSWSLEDKRRLRSRQNTPTNLMHLYCASLFVRPFIVGKLGGSESRLALGLELDRDGGNGGILREDEDHFARDKVEVGVASLLGLIELNADRHGSSTGPGIRAPKSRWKGEEVANGSKATKYFNDCVTSLARSAL